MINTIKNMLGMSKAVNYSELVTNGAIILDVRTKNEYQNGHIKGSLNIPLQNLNENLSKLKKDSIIITCCASGMRSASAKNILKSNGFNEVHNGGGWMSLKNKI